MSRFDEDRRRASTLLRSVLLASALCGLAATPASAAAPNWLESADLSKPGRDASNPAVAMDDAGNTVAIWERQSTVDSSHNIQLSTRVPGGAFSAPVDLALKPTEPSLLMTPGGEAVAVWKRLENKLEVTPGYRIEVATRPPGGVFGPPVTVYSAQSYTDPVTKSVTVVIPQGVEVAVGPNGDVAVTWSNIDLDSGFDKVTCEEKVVPVPAEVKCSNPLFVMAAVRPAGGTFTAAKRISTPRGVEEPPGGEDPKDKEEREKAESKLSASGAKPAVDAAGNVAVVWSAFNGTDNVIQSSVREAGKEFTPPAQVSQSGEDAGGADIGMDSAGNAIATWVRTDGPAVVVQAGLRPPGGSFSVLGDLSPVGSVSEGPDLDVTLGGTATVVWRLTGFSESFLQVATRAPGGAFSKPLNITSGKDNPLYAEVDTNEAGDAIVVWSGVNGADQIARASVRPAGAGFGPPVAISQASTFPLHPEPSIDEGGNATVVWVRDNGSHSIIQWAGYDADPPELRNVSIPGAATVGDTVPFSASSYDVWPIGKPSFDFGDGGQAVGDSVTHVYSAPGAYAVSASTTDGAGRTVTSAGTVQVKARNYFTIGKLRKNRKRGTATLSVTIPEPGTIVASGKGIRKATARAAKAGVVKVLLKASGKGLKKLNKNGKLKTKLKVAYTPDGGDLNVKRLKMVLSKRLGGQRVR